MPNLRIIYDNIADTATITATSTSGSLSTSNLKKDIKGLVHRSIGNSVTYTLVWASARTIGGVALPATNLSATATIEVRLYSNSAATSLISTLGLLLACPGLPLGLWDWNMPINANSFSFGGALKSAVWFPNTSGVFALEIILNDIANPAGYIDCSRIVCGTYWEPKHSVQLGLLNITINDLLTTERSDAGDLIPSRSVLYDGLRFDLAYLEEADRYNFLQIAKLVGKSRNILVCVFPDNSNSTLTTDTLIYGKLSGFLQTQQVYGFYSMPLEIEGW